MLTSTSQKLNPASHRRGEMSDIAERPNGKQTGLGQMLRAWEELNAMAGETERAIARIEICREQLRAAIAELTSAIDRRAGELEERQFCPECNAGPGEQHSVHCSLEHGPEMERER